MQESVRIAVLDALYMVLPQLKKVYSLDDYSVHLDPSIGDAFIQKEHFPSIMGGGITGDIEINDKDLYHPPKTIYCNEGSQLILDKLATDSTKGSIPTRDDVMHMFCSAWDKTTSDFDMELAFKQNAITISLGGPDDGVVKTSLSTMVMEEMKKFWVKLLQSPAPTTMKEHIIPPEEVKRNNKPPGKPLDEECELLDGEYFGESDEEDEELENSVAQEDENHPDVTGSKNEDPIDLYALML